MNRNTSLRPHGHRHPPLAPVLGAAGALMGMALMALTSAASTNEFALWPEGVPERIADGSAEVTTREGGITRVKTIHEPTLQAFPATDGNTGAAVVICPGGGYGIVAIEHEGWDVARWLNTAGINAFVLKYRLSPYRHPVPLMDAQQAMRTVRARAAEWGVAPNRIGVMGFSAGGHLASTVMTHGDRPVRSDGPLGQVSCRADFAILGYPVISMVNPTVTHRGSVANLLGQTPDPELLRRLSAECQVTAQTPPAFLFHAKDDRGVLPDNSLLLAQALERCGVNAEVFLLDSGGHGFGLRRDEWTKPCLAWLGRRGFLRSGTD